MAAKVIDASAIAAILFGESQADTVALRLQEAELYAPVLLEFELANVCLVKCRRHPDQRQDLVAAFEHRGDFGIEPLEVDASGVLSTALETGLNAYDASYLWLSRRLRAELVTLDNALAKAAGGSAS
jgi:predicted nucleic acid-binding protein